MKMNRYYELHCPTPISISPIYTFIHRFSSGLDWSLSATICLPLLEMTMRSSESGQHSNELKYFKMHCRATVMGPRHASLW